MQKHYFDPTFGGAIVNGQRNVFQALDSISPFASLSVPQLVSDRQRFQDHSGGLYDLEQIFNTIPKSKDSSPSARS